MGQEGIYTGRFLIYLEVTHIMKKKELLAIKKFLFYTVL